jgi:hypothetical protein
VTPGSARLPQTTWAWRTCTALTRTASPGRTSAPPHAAPPRHPASSTRWRTRRRKRAAAAPGCSSCMAATTPAVSSPSSGPSAGFCESGYSIPPRVRDAVASGCPALLPNSWGQLQVCSPAPRIAAGPQVRKSAKADVQISPAGTARQWASALRRDCGSAPWHCPQRRNASVTERCASAGTGTRRRRCRVWMSLNRYSTPLMRPVIMRVYST